MKKLLFILLIITSFSKVMGQTINTSSFSTSYNENKPSYTNENKLLKTLSLKSYLVARHEYKKSSKDTFSPKFSVDLLDGKGIHLFSISNMGIIPNVNVGARITAGIKISI